MSDTIRVLVVDDSSVMRVGLSALVEVDPGLVVVGEAADGEEAIARAEETQPDVVLLDVRMPNRGGLSVVAELAARAKVIMLTFTDDDASVRTALSEGACGYLVHGTFDADSLTALVRSALTGASVLSPPAVAVLQGRLGVPAVAARGAAVDDPWGLSSRQREVMALVADGATNGDIASSLYLAEKTVKNHINQIFMRMGVTSRGAAIAAWHRAEREQVREPS